MNTPPPLPPLSRPASSWTSHALGAAGGLGFTCCIAAGLVLFSRAPDYVEEEEVAEIRAVDFPEPPPPPPQTLAPGTPLPPAPMIFEEAPSTSTVRIAPTPIPITPLITEVRPQASLQFSFTPGQFRPSSRNYEPDVNHIFQRSEVDQQIVAIFKKAPNIPTALLKQVRDPRVRVLFVVNTNGSVEDVRLLKGVHPEFDRLVVEAIAEWRFRPAMRKGRKVRCITELPVHVRAPTVSPFSVQ